MAAEDEDLPRDAKIVKTLLKSMMMVMVMMMMMMMSLLLLAYPLLSTSPLTLSAAIL
ncbi:Hypothetical predicted protein [Prunus dulcis]|uniref:Uncharacterized protein n=1 Tax=Prunus dulcis TaxID=3755 RepID=A0A5E4F214_PRUDU|nr:Hypothetical predicted protein [Prunus dulcis]